MNLGLSSALILFVKTVMTDGTIAAWSRSTSAERPVGPA